MGNFPPASCPLLLPDVHAGWSALLAAGFCCFFPLCRETFHFVFGFAEFGERARRREPEATAGPGFAGGKLALAMVEWGQPGFSWPLAASAA